MEKLIANESYPKGLGLTPEMACYNRLWRLFREIQNRSNRVRMPYVGFGFKAIKPSAEDPLVPISKGKPIRKASEIALVALVPDKNMHGPVAYRLAALTIPFTNKNGKCFAGGIGSRIFQRNYAKNPVTRQQEWNSKCFDPAWDADEKVEAQSFSELRTKLTEANEQSGDSIKAPHAGMFRVEVNSLHVNFTLNGTRIFRFALADHDKLSIQETDKNVKKGDVLAELTDAVDYLEAKFTYVRGRAKPDMRPHNRDVMLLSEETNSNVELVRMLNKMFEDMIDQSLSDHGDNDRSPGPIGSTIYFPKAFEKAIFKEDVFENLLHGAMGESGEENPMASCVELRKRILKAVSPTAEDPFEIKSTRAGQIVEVDREDCLFQLTFDSGDVTVIPLSTALIKPLLALLHGEETEPFPVEVGDVLGDWVERRVYSDWGDLDLSMEGCLPWLIQKYLWAAATRVTDENGNPMVEIDSALVGPALSHCRTELRLDFTETMKYLELLGPRYFNEKDGTIVFPVCPHEIGKFEKNINGVVYNYRPLGLKTFKPKYRVAG